MKFNSCSRVNLVLLIFPVLEAGFGVKILNWCNLFCLKILHLFFNVCVMYSFKENEVLPVGAEVLRIPRRREPYRGRVLFKNRTNSSKM